MNNQFDVNKIYKSVLLLAKPNKINAIVCPTIHIIDSIDKYFSFITERFTKLSHSFRKLSCHELRKFL